jgi:hypothetical protein
MNVWFLTGAMPHVATELLAGFARLEGWRGRMAAIGHGRRTELTGPEALEIARTSSPAVIVANDKDDPLGLAPGDQVMVAADDYGRDPIVGALVAANAERVVIARDEAILGRLHLHFPRVGYRVEPG